MPTPVGVARQCLAEAAAAVLDDAVAVARRRSHGQTTSLHAVSALLALPASNLREACARARSSAYSPRLQFRALELCVGVALDRISVSKTSGTAEEEPPPVSNSLMAAIKRSQAHQRRHPETFHLYQQQLVSSNSNSISAVKVELKHFVMSILDDPIVSRVFDDAGFRTHEIKLAILNPIAMSRFSSPNSRPPPLFLCSLRDFELNKNCPNFPFPESASVNGNFDDNSRRIGEILLTRNRRNPLLIGACASDAYRNFIDSLHRGESEVLPKQIDGLKVASIENEISEFINGVISEDSMGLKLKRVNQMVEDCQGVGVIATCGDMKAIIDAKSADVATFIVSELKKLLTNKPGARLWLIGFLASDGDYTKLVNQFPSIEKDWDLHLLPVTTSISGKCFTSSLMKSFVPFGGFFPMPSELESPSTTATQPSKLCKLCNEKCDQEVNAVLNGQLTDSVADKQSVNLSSCWQIAERETSKVSRTVEAKEDKAVLDARILGLRRKWSDICQRLHCSQKSQGDVHQAKSHSSSIPFQKVPISMGSLSDGGKITNSSPCIASDLQKSPQAEQNIYEPSVLTAHVNAQALEMNNLRNASDSQPNMKVPVDDRHSSSVLSVTTDLRLGTCYDSVVDSRRKPNIQDCTSRIQNSESSISCQKSSSHVPSSCSREKYTYVKDLEHQWKVLAEKIHWQVEAIHTISQTVLRCKNASGRHHFSNRGNMWLGFLGPDKVGKRKIASSMAEIVFGRKEHLLILDLNTQDMGYGIKSVVDSCNSEYQNIRSGRKMIVDHLADKLRKHPHSIVLLENVEKADFLVRHSLSQAVKTGKFPDSYGRDININNAVFVLASTVLKGSSDLPLYCIASEFPEEKVLDAKNLQMQILVESSRGIIRRHDSRNVLVTTGEVSNHCPVSKRKSVDNDSTKSKMSKRVCCIPIIDLNLPVEEDAEENSNTSEDTNDSLDNAGLWLEELLEHVDKNVVFNPFDFDSLSQKILKEINLQLKKANGDTSLLEIHRDVMAQILAAAWLSDEENALEDWIKCVLCTSIQEAQLKHDARGDFVAKLMPCDGLVVEEQASGICLPARINSNG